MGFAYCFDCLGRFISRGDASEFVTATSESMVQGTLFDMEEGEK